MKSPLLPAVAAAVFLLGACSHLDRIGEGKAPAAKESGEEKATLNYVDERVGDLHFHYAQSPGVVLRAFDIPVLNTSLIAVVTPGWGDQYYVSFNNMNMMRDARVEDYEGGRRLVVHHVLEEGYDSPFSATETHAILPGNVYKVTLDFFFDSDDPAILEWRVGGFNPNLVAGVPFSATLADQSISGVVPYEAAGPTAAVTTVARNFHDLTINSRIGEIVIESTPGEDLVLFDYRKNHYAMDDNPMFWFGYLERPIPARQSMRYEYTIRFPEQLATDARDAGDKAVVASPGEDATVRIPNLERNHIIPLPKSVEHTDDLLPLGPSTTIYTGPNPGEGIHTAVDFLVRDLVDIYEIEPQVVFGAAPDNIPAGSILLAERDRWDVPTRKLEELGLEIPGHDEGYALHVDGDHALVAANTDQGVFYGVTTLVQLVTVRREEIGLRGTRITDYPSLDFRGIHALSGRGTGNQIAKAVRELMARYKLNSFIWECQYIIWDSAPELEHPQYGMTKADAQLVIDATSRYFVDLIPLIQSLGHSEWIFTNGHNLDIAEDPETPYAYNPTNPRTYEFIFMIFQEALDFFDPKGFHIGHDEVTMRGRFPYRSRESGLSVTDLILMDTIKLNNWFREKGIDVYLWGDMFLHSSEAPDATFAPSPEIARERRDRLPKDMIVTDWHYQPVPADEYTSIPLWRDEGFRVIGAGWYTPANIHQLAIACIEAGVMGYLQTTWAGFNFRIDGNEAAWFQYWAYILAAHYAWSGDERTPNELPFIPKDEFINTWFRTKPLLGEKSGRHIDLTGAFNRTIVDEDGTQWLGYGPQNDFRSLPEGIQLMGETVFNLPRNDRDEAAVLFLGKMNPPGVYPTSVTLETGGMEASELRLLMTTNFPTREHAKVATIDLVYQDGSKASLPLEYGRNIFAFSDFRSGSTARIAWEGESLAGTSLRLWDIEWENPNPKKPIQSIRLTSAGTEAAPILFAITAVD